MLFKKAKAVNSIKREQVDTYYIKCYVLNLEPKSSTLNLLYQRYSEVSEHNPCQISNVCN